MTRGLRSRTALALAVLSMAMLSLEMAPALAQDAATGRVSGRVTSATAGDVVPEGLIVRLIAVEQGRLGETVEAPLRGGRYEARVPARAERSYVVHVAYQGVDYFAQPVTFTGGALEAQRDFLVYAATREPPPLAITSTVVTVLAIDRGERQIGIEREDRIANPSDRVYIGDETGVTLRIPAPDGTVNAGGQNADGAFAFENGVVTTTVPLRPGALTSIVTRYVVGYDAAADRFRMRVTAPLPAERVAVRVPASYARRLEPAEGARRSDDERVSGTGGTDGAGGEVLRVAQSRASLQPGGSLIVDLVGLSGSVQSNPLTERPGALIAAAAALAIIGGGAAAAGAWRRRGA